MDPLDRAGFKDHTLVRDDLFRGRLKDCGESFSCGIAVAQRDFMSMGRLEGIGLTPQEPVTALRLVECTRTDPEIRKQFPRYGKQMLERTGEKLKREEYFVVAHHRFKTRELRLRVIFSRTTEDGGAAKVNPLSDVAPYAA
jgi:hypothetical protein